MRRGNILVNAYYFCKRGRGVCNCVLMWCHVVYKLWTMIYGLLSTNWMMAGSIRDKIWAWKGIRGRKETNGLNTAHHLLGSAEGEE